MNILILNQWSYEALDNDKLVSFISVMKLLDYVAILQEDGNVHVLKNRRGDPQVITYAEHKKFVTFFCDQAAPRTKYKSFLYPD